MVQPYSPSRRTALVLTGTGAHGAYHAGVLRALQEAGVKIDLIAGHGVGAGSAALGAIDGAGRLWDPQGIWRSPRVRQLYRWRWPLRLAAWIGLVLVTMVTPGLWTPRVVMQCETDESGRITRLYSVMATCKLARVPASDAGANR